MSDDAMKQVNEVGAQFTTMKKVGLFLFYSIDMPQLGTASVIVDPSPQVKLRIVNTRPYVE